MPLGKPNIVIILADDLGYGDLPLWFFEREAALAAPVSKPPGPNDRPGIALVGCGGRGSGGAGVTRL